MSESQDAKRVLSQAAELASAQIDVQDNDIRQLKDKNLHKDGEIESLKERLWAEILERNSQQKKAETSQIFMFLFGCLTAVSIAYSILNCQ